MLKNKSIQLNMKLLYQGTEGTFNDTLNVIKMLLRAIGVTCFPLHKAGHSENMLFIIDGINSTEAGSLSEEEKEEDKNY